jgi:hypothetical protein
MAPVSAPATMGATASLDRGGPQLRYRFDQQPGQQVGQSVAEFVFANIPLFKLWAAAVRCAGPRRLCTVDTLAGHGTHIDRSIA